MRKRCSAKCPQAVSASAGARPVADFHVINVNVNYFAVPSRCGGPIPGQSEQWEIAEARWSQLAGIRNSDIDIDSLTCRAICRGDVRARQANASAHWSAAQYAPEPAATMRMVLAAINRSLAMDQFST
jgi:hypothetical protein